ncbi:MAG: TetR/AcrR family transcriptional regulator [Clostridia bacterium]|nr:TetR/AcrR family transcriptional regulator [Clostridia bacterium]
MQIKKAHVKDNIIKTSRKLFMTQGYNKVTMKSIADSSGVSVSNIYTYFKSKTELFDAVVAEGYEALERFRQKHTTEIVWTNQDSWTIQSEANRYQELINLFYDHRSVFIILIVKSKGSKHENFYENLIQEIIQRKQYVVEASQKRGLLLLKKPFPNHLIETYVRSFMIKIVNEFKRELPKCELQEQIYELTELFFIGFKGYRA